MHNTNCPVGNWLKQLKTKLEREIFLRLKDRGMLPGGGEEPLSERQVARMCMALAQLNTADAARRKFVIKTLFRACGTHATVGCLHTSIAVGSWFCPLQQVFFHW
jgi:hypothetical protein